MLLLHLLLFTSDLANNKLKSIQGLSGLTKLRKLDLGANRIRIMEESELSGLINLEELWIGKNKIEQIQGLEKVRIVEYDCDDWNCSCEVCVLTYLPLHHFS